MYLFFGVFGGWDSGDWRRVGCDWVSDGSSDSVRGWVEIGWWWCCEGVVVGEVVK